LRQSGGSGLRGSRRTDAGPMGHERVKPRSRGEVVRSSTRVADLLRGCMVLPRRHRWTYAVVAAVYAAFLVSTVPGVRPTAGYNLVLDGVLNTLAYLGSAAVCLLRARDVQAYRRSFHVLGIGLTLYGLGNIVWTVFVRTQDPEPFPTAADGLWLSFYPC